MATMKVALVPKAGADFEIGERDIPAPGPGHVRIRVQAHRGHQRHRPGDSEAEFVSEGAYVVVTGRRDRELAAAVKEMGSNVTGVQGDVSNLGDLNRLFAQITRERARLDIVFANAGVARYARSA